MTSATTSLDQITEDFSTKLSTVKRFEYTVHQFEGRIFSRHAFPEAKMFSNYTQKWLNLLCITSPVLKKVNTSIGL